MPNTRKSREELRKNMKIIRGGQAETAPLRAPEQPYEKLALKDRDRVGDPSHPVPEGNQAFCSFAPDGRIASANQAFCDLTGYSLPEVKTLTWDMDLTPSRWRSIGWAAVEALQATQKPMRYEKEIVRKDGARIPVEVLHWQITEPDSDDCLLHVFVTDITERKLSERAVKDFENIYRAVFETGAGPVAVIDPDLTVALCNPGFERLSGFSAKDVEGKMTWTQFFVPAFAPQLLDLHAQAKNRAAENLQCLFLDRAGRKKQVCLSLAAISGSDRIAACLTDIGELKRPGKNLPGWRLKIGRGSKKQRATLSDLEADLDRAVKRREFILHYQPVVSLNTGEPTGFEALVRWKRPGRGLTMPGAFIAPAEKTGLILPVGRRVLRQACSDMAGWIAQNPKLAKMTVSVNLSAGQFADPHLVRGIKRVLKSTGLPGRNLRLEISETALTENRDRAARILPGLKKLGVKICVDGFGAGCSCLRCLHDLPIDGLKIDRSLIRTMDNPGTARLVRTLIGLGRELGARVTAIGVENQKQLARLKKMKCPLAQGYLFSRPLNRQKTARLLARQK